MVESGIWLATDPIEQKCLNIITADAWVVGPPATEGLVALKVKGLGLLLVKVSYLLVELKESKGEFSIGDPTSR